MDVKELSERIREATPFIKHLGVEITRGAGGEYAELRMPMRDELTQNLGHAHGGVIGSLADMAANLACKQPTVTVEYKINFLAAAKGDELVARSRILKEGSKLIIVESRVYTANTGTAETLVAVCQGTLIPVKT